MAKRSESHAANIQLFSSPASPPLPLPEPTVAASCGPNILVSIAGKRWHSSPAELESARFPLTKVGTCVVVGMGGSGVGRRSELARGIIQRRNASPTSSTQRNAVEIPGL